MYSYNPFGKSEQLVRVTGIEGAKAYQMLPNSTVALFDGNEDYFYLKTTDGAGFPTIRVFKFEEVQESPSCEYLTKAEFEKFRKELLNGEHDISETEN